MASIKFVVLFIYAVLAVLVSARSSVHWHAPARACAEYLIACVQVLFIHPDGLPARQQALHRARRG